MFKSDQTAITLRGLPSISLSLLLQALVLKSSAWQKPSCMFCVSVFAKVVGGAARLAVSGVYA